MSLNFVCDAKGESALDTPCDKMGRQALTPPVIKRRVRLDILREVSTIYILLAQSSIVEVVGVIIVSAVAVGKEVVLRSQQKSVIFSSVNSISSSLSVMVLTVPSSLGGTAGFVV